MDTIFTRKRELNLRYSDDNVLKASRTCSLARQIRNTNVADTVQFAGDWASISWSETPPLRGSVKHKPILRNQRQS
jgi:hypothetical protein